jgi:hypothetical protein
MAKRRTDRPQQERVKSTEIHPQISQKRLRSLLATNRKVQNDITEIAGGLGSEIKEAVETHHLHRKAFNVVKMCDRMEPEKLADFLDHLEHYLEISGMNERAASAPQLSVVAGTDHEEGEDGEPEEPAGRRGRGFPPPSGVAAE